MLHEMGRVEDAKKEVKSALEYPVECVLGKRKEMCMLLFHCFCFFCWTVAYSNAGDCKAKLPIHIGHCMSIVDLMIFSLSTRAGYYQQKDGLELLDALASGRKPDFEKHPDPQPLTTRPLSPSEMCSQVNYENTRRRFGILHRSHHNKNQQQQQQQQQQQME